ncbi:hypothetical protein [Streptomyces sp. NPDC006879]|uniref:hypothetical protein n=1 Tax=Streptomyces sp. NPDC006879 TaxID=3364767 RepID=UPI0036B5B736
MSTVSITRRLTGPTRPSAAEANDAIRMLVEYRAAQPRGADWPAEAYEFLLSEWAEAVRREDTGVTAGRGAARGR